MTYVDDKDKRIEQLSKRIDVLVKGGREYRERIGKLEEDINTWRKRHELCMDHHESIAVLYKDVVEVMNDVIRKHGNDRRKLEESNGA